MFVAHTLLWLKFRTQRQVRNAGWHYSLYSSSVLLSSILSFPRILGVSERQVRLRTAKFKDKKNINVVNMPGVHSKNADVDPGSPPVKPVKLGASYKTFSEVEAAMAEYEVKFNVPYVTNGSKLVGTYNKQKGTDLPNNLKYSRIKYACKHHGQGRPSSKGIRPNQNTFKQGCPAIVIFNVNLETRELEVSTEVTNHVHLHETDPSDFPNYPENRRGNIKKDVLEEVEKLLDLNVETTRLLEYLELFKNKSLTAQDVANIKAKLKKTRRQGRSESEEFFDELESLLQKDPGSKVIFGADPIAEDSEEEDNEEADDPNDAKEKRTKAQLNYVYFHTAEMGETFEKFSDVLVADSTYCTNKYDMPLMAFLCLDENGNGRVAGYCLMRDESKANVKNAVSAFCAAHPTAQSKVRTVLVDKDYNEREAIRELFPDAVIHICLFHTLQIFQRQSKTEPDKENVRIVLEGIAYSESKEAYIELYDKLKSVASALFIKYFDENWNNCHECWALFHRDMSVNCGQTTTNIAESHNQKIKAILKKKRASMVELLRNLLLLHSSKTSRVAMNAFNSKVKIRYITNSDDPVVQKITNLTTPFVGDLLKTQYNWAMEKASMPDALPANFDYSSCTCRFYKSFQLPCSHIFLGRLRGDVEIFDVENIPDRWQKNAPSAEQHNEDSVAVYVPNRLKKKTKPLMENERFNLVVEKTERLTQMVKTCGGNQFSRRLTALQKIEDIWSRGKEIIVLEEGIGEFLCENIVLVDDDHQTLNSNETEQVCPSGEVNNNSEKRDENPSRKVITKSREDAKRRGDLTCAETGAKSLKVTSAEQYKFLDPNLRSTLTLPVGHVPKGRPKGKQRQTVIGRKRQDKPKQLVQASSSQSQTSETISQTCYCAEEPPAVRRKCTNGGPNNGRYFFACHKSHKEGNCNFFVWDTPICACGDQCIMRKTRTGQTYYGCWKHQCQVVFWLDEEVDHNTYNVITAEKDILLEEAEHVEKEVEYNEESETYNGSENGNEDDDDDDVQL
ncbi:hypothetical protein FOCC_FOCC003159 [Frankliniella occidentalis]|nr:hypothetical protein FOCC_FOCC003159 [Frankliniella occidentalis]